MTPALRLLATIALVLHILFSYLLPPVPDWRYRTVVSALVIVIVLLLSWSSRI